ncbi:hypothetical protein TNCV_236911 [Trichonephila clavipes]|nr:hypothetical protein TNCV_236911 [Trichonephila clavipes]
MTALFPAILINHHPDSINKSGVTSTQSARTSEADDCVIHCPAHRHHHNCNFSILSGGSISPQTSTSKDS